MKGERANAASLRSRPRPAVRSRDNPSAIVPGRLPFGHPPRTLAFWRRLVQRALGSTPTPFFLCSAEPIQEALQELHCLAQRLPVPVRHWLSCKTQPLRPLLAWWRKRGGGVEVVSEFEFLAALAEGFSPPRILVNGPAKHRWLPRHAVPGICVNFDSLREVSELLPLARQLNWTVGVRCHTTGECDPDQPSCLSQFGMAAAEAVSALKRLQRSGLALETIHFHLRTNVPSPAYYERALQEVAAICRAARFSPRYLDCGGGFPAPYVLSPEGRAYNAGFDLDRLAEIYQRALKQFEDVEELWLENGRFVSARSGVLAVQIVDVKERGGMRYLICDGGRTLQALVSDWEAHEMFSLPRRGGPDQLTTVCGPTCMAFDHLTRRPMPRDLRVGDSLVWMEAGAYHLSWETRFSHGLAAVLWHENGQVSAARSAEVFEQWWNDGGRRSREVRVRSGAGQPN